MLDTVHAVGWIWGAVVVVFWDPAFEIQERYLHFLKVFEKMGKWSAYFKVGSVLKMNSSAEIFADLECLTSPVDEFWMDKFVGTLSGIWEK